MHKLELNQNYKKSLLFFQNHITKKIKNKIEIKWVVGHSISNGWSSHPLYFHILFYFVLCFFKNKII
jgi:hypothetical protein